MYTESLSNNIKGIWLPISLKYKEEEANSHICGKEKVGEEAVHNSTSEAAEDITTLDRVGQGWQGRTMMDKVETTDISDYLYKHCFFILPFRKNIQ